jgi:predicted glycoside hydrolase/deacetylase ChbG (UPF0249 family)
MAKVETHIKDCEHVLGESFEHVHRWLDELAKKWNPMIHLEYHRQFRHHAEGIAYIKKRWGFYAERAGKLHIIRDNEMYLNLDIISYAIRMIREDQIDELYEQALKYCHPIKKGWEKETI